MGSVYKAVDKILDVPVALKIMSNKIVHDEKTLERFKREVILARKVGHRNACRIYDIGESDGTHYVSMEYLQGTTLAEMVQVQGPLPPEIGVPIIKQVLLALQEAHRVGVIHRDLKPANIMVDFNLHAAIMDFGISISADANRVTQTGAFVGTAHYMAPEQFEGRNIDKRTDIYSVGVIMFEIFTGSLPFEADSPMAIIFAHLKSSPRKPSTLVPDFPQELERIILKALEKEVQNRYQNCRELLDDLEPLDKPTTQSASMREGVAHKLLAEQSYSKAIKYIRTLLKTNPQNQEWKKLLNIAVSEKAGKDLRRARSLIRKRNLIQAQLLIEKIDRMHSDNKRVSSELRKIESFFHKKRDSVVESYIKEAEQFVAQKDWSSAMTRLEAASNLKSKDPRIGVLEEKILAEQQKEASARLLQRVAD